MVPHHRPGVPNGRRRVGVHLANDAVRPELRLSVHPGAGDPRLSVQPDVPRLPAAHRLLHNVGEVLRPAALRLEPRQRRLQRPRRVLRALRGAGLRVRRRAVRRARAHGAGRAVQVLSRCMVPDRSHRDRSAGCLHVRRAGPRAAEVLFQTVHAIRQRYLLQRHAGHLPPQAGPGGVRRRPRNLPRRGWLARRQSMLLHQHAMRVSQAGARRVRTEGPGPLGVQSDEAAAVEQRAMRSPINRGATTTACRTCCTVRWHSRHMIRIEVAPAARRAAARCGTCGRRPEPSVNRLHQPASSARAPLPRASALPAPPPRQPLSTTCCHCRVALCTRRTGPAFGPPNRLSGHRP
eukprot:m.41624 g.41624  ORF g.41624 m.41624 type:complete len:349 (-) comp14244_c0_seq1:247-1293(-)